ncbi:MAG TPA: C39 family peptidase [Candidatus Binatia bacterium]|nr:C39 family peptidase [Candidatus Binatia bacterium]
MARSILSGTAQRREACAGNPFAILKFPGVSLNLVLLVALASLVVSKACAADFDARGGQFVGFHHFSGFKQSAGGKPGEIVLTSPEIIARIPWNELVASWNADTPDGTYLKIEARAVYPTNSTKFYTMGLWSSNPARFPRESVPHQKDADGDVSTDTLVLNRPTERLQVRVTLGGVALPKLKFLGLALTDTTASLDALSPNGAAWERVIPVPERSQMAYPNGKVLCSPTTVSMLMTYWSKQLKRPELDHDVPDIVNAIYDAQWKGTGNWPFNTAYAGSYRGVRAYVTRLSDLSEVEDWIACGIPLGLSVCSDRLHHRGPGPNGHLIVCVGFTKEGDPIVNDPGSSKNVRRVYPRKDIIYAWAYSHNAVYIIYPENSGIPTDRFGHWDSWTAHQRIRLE